MRTNMRRVVLGASCALLASMSVAADVPDARARVDQLFQPWSRSDAPGCTVAATQDGRTLLERGYGMADLEQGVANRPQTVFNIASISKQFTTTAIALLAQDGLLSLDDDVRKHVPELPDYGTTITIRHLAHHTSGLRDYLSLLLLSGWNWLDDIPVARVLDIVARQKTLDSAPGTQIVYSNTGYVLMAVIIERVSGKTLGEFTRQRIFEPLDMQQTRFYDDSRMIVPGRALGYMKLADGSYGAWRPSYAIVGEGGLLTTAQDLAAWGRNFLTPRLGRDPQQLVSELLRPGHLIDGRPTGYGLGLDLLEYRGLRTVQHDGQVIGYSSIMLYLPTERFGVYVLCNAGGAPAEKLARGVADIYLEGRFKSGTAPTVFTVEPPAAGKPVSSKKHGPVAVSLADYAGVYYSEELDVNYVVRPAKDSLAVTVGYLPPARWSATAKDRFECPDRFGFDDLNVAATFVRDARGAVTGLRIDTGRVHGIRFERVADHAGQR